MKRQAALLIALSTTVFGGSAFAVTPERIRGTISGVTGDAITVDEAGGKTVTIATDKTTHYAGVVASSLDSLKKNDFIGTATKGPPSFMVALEVVIFPDSMRGTGEGHYAWDSIPDTTAKGSTAKSSMTNGTVTSATQAVAPKTHSSMTNGTVSATTGGAGGGVRHLTVTYKGGTSSILVPSSAPIVAFQPGDPTLAVKGAKVFVIAAGAPDHLAAKFVAVGQGGVTPPM